MAQRLTQVTGLNPGAALYAVDAAKHLGLVTERLSWDDYGLLLALIHSYSPDSASFPADLTPESKHAFFIIFFTYDGDILLQLLRRLAQGDRLIGSSNALAADVVRSAYEERLKLARDPSDRIRLKEGLSRAQLAYQGRTGAHKLFIHLQALVRLGLIERASTRERIYHCTNPQPLEVILRAVPDVSRLDLLVMNKQLGDLGATALGHAQEACISDRALDESSVARQLFALYRVSERAGISLCPVQILIEATQAVLAARTGPLSYSAILGILSNIQARIPRAVRFQVDRFGKPTFLKLSDDVEHQLP